jgi:hypothetical protein
LIEIDKELSRLRQVKSYSKFYKEKVLKEHQINEEEAEERGISLHPKPRSFYFLYKTPSIQAHILDKKIEYYERQHLTIKNGIEQ